MPRISYAAAVVLLLAGCATTGRHPACNDRANRCVQACPASPRGPAPRTPLPGTNDPHSLCEQACTEEARSCEAAEAQRDRDEAAQAASKLPAP